MSATQETPVEAPGALNRASATEAFVKLLGGDEEGDAPTETPAEGSQEEEPSEPAADPKPEGEESESEETEEEPKEEGDDEESNEIRTTEELAAALGKTPEEALSGIKHKFKVAGEEVEATLAELVSGYQRDGDYRQKTQKIAEERTTLRQQHAEAAKEYGQRAAGIANLLKAEQQAVYAQFNSPEVARLRTENPAEYLIQKDWAESRLKHINQTIEAGHRDWVKTQEELRSRKLEDGLKWIKEKHPDFGEEHGKRAASVLRGDFSFSEDDLRELDDLRVVALANEVAVLREQVSKHSAVVKQGAEAVKQAKPVPKLMKPGAQKASRSDAQQLSAKHLQAVNRLKQTGSRKDAAEAFLLSAQLQEQRGKRK